MPEVEAIGLLGGWKGYRVGTVQRFEAGEKGPRVQVWVELHPEGWMDVELFGRSKEKCLATFLRLAHGIPSHDTFGRVFACIDPDRFERCFQSWTSALAGLIVGVVAIDGKTLRRSFDAADGKAAIHMISAWAADNRVVFGQLTVDGKTNEITAIPTLLAMLDIKGLTVTIDAMGCQKAIAEQIVAQGGDYMLQVKANQPELHADIQKVFEGVESRGWGKRAHDERTRFDKGHGRIEKRRTLLTWDVPWLIKASSDWKGLRGIVMVERERTLGEATAQTAMAIMSLSGCRLPCSLRLSGISKKNAMIELAILALLGRRPPRQTQGSIRSPPVRR